MTKTKKEAEELYDRLIEANRSGLAPLIGKAQLLCLMPTRTADCKEIVQRLNRIVTPLALTTYNLELLLLLKDQKYEEVLEHSKKVLLIDPKSGQCRIVRSSAYEKLGKIADAIKEYPLHAFL